MPDMLKTYNQLYEQYNDDKVGGLVGRSQTQDGKITPTEFTKPLMTYSEYGVDDKGNYKCEDPRSIKIDVLRIMQIVVLYFFFGK